MKMRNLILSILAALPLAATVTCAPSALADEAPASVRLGHCYEFTMCDGFSGTGDCTGAGGDEASKDLAGFFDFALYSTESDATTYSCDLTTASVNHDAGGSSSNVTISGGQVTNSSEAVWLQGVLRHTWVNCTANTGGGATVTVKLTACPVARR